MTHDQKPGFELAAFMVFIGGALVWQTLKKYREKLLVEDVALIPIKSAPQGLVELQGYAWPLKPVVSPLTNKSAIFFYIKVEEYVQQGRSGSWRVIYEERSSESFFVADNSGLALVDPEKGEFDLTTKTSGFRSLLEGERTGLINYLNQRGIQLANFGFALRDKFRVTESIVYPGSPLFCVGSFKTTQELGKVSPYPGIQDFFSKIKMYRSAPAYTAGLVHEVSTNSLMDTRQLYIALAEQAGHGFLNFAAVSGEPVAAQMVSAPCFGLVTHNLENGEKLFFADCHQEELIQRLSRWQNLRLIGGALLIALGAAYAMTVFIH